MAFPEEYKHGIAVLVGDCVMEVALCRGRPGPEEWDAVEATVRERYGDYDLPAPLGLRLATSEEVIRAKADEPDQDEWEVIA